jgi:hypothetical protein
MKKILIILSVLSFLLSCGSPRFEIQESENTGSTFYISYFFPTSADAKNMKMDIPIIFVFSENIDSDSAIRGLTIEKTGPSQRQSVKPVCTYNESEFMLQCLPESKRWEVKSNYSVKIKDVKSKDGTKSLDKEYTFTFSTI